MNTDRRTGLGRILAGIVVMACLASSALPQENRAATRHSKKLVVAHKTLSHPRQVRAVLSPSDFPITLTAFDRVSSDEATSNTVLEISRNGFKGTKAAALYTKALDGEQINSVVSWQNTERTHFGFLVLTTPSEGNLYSVLFFLYHDGKLTMPIDEVATGYPVFPTIRKTEKSGQIQISFNEGSSDATNDKIKTVVLYTWSDYSRRFVKNVHTVAAEAVERHRPAKVEKTQAAGGD